MKILELIKQGKAGKWFWIYFVFSCINVMFLYYPSGAEWVSMLLGMLLYFPWIYLAMYFHIGLEPYVGLALVSTILNLIFLYTQGKDPKKMINKSKEVK